MQSHSTRAIEARIRRKLSKQGQALTKYREDSRWFNQYGPYAIVDEQTNGILSSGHQLDELARQLSA